MGKQEARRLWCAVSYNCRRNCAMRINAAIGALVPAADYLQGMLPMMKEYLPADMYGVGFVVLALVNAVLHVRVPVEPVSPKAEP